MRTAATSALQRQTPPTRHRTVAAAAEFAACPEGNEGL